MRMQFSSVVLHNLCSKSKLLACEAAFAGDFPSELLLDPEELLLDEEDPDDEDPEPELESIKLSN